MTQNIMLASSALPQVLISQQVAATETTQYTCPSASAVKIASAVLTNTSGSAATISLSMVPSGGTAGSANRILSAYSLAAGDSTVVSELVGQFLGPSDFISGLAGTASAITLAISGVVFS